jgi:hypothetical protein
MKSLVHFQFNNYESQNTLETMIYLNGEYLSLNKISNKKYFD